MIHKWSFSFKSLSSDRNYINYITVFLNSSIALAINLPVLRLESPAIYVLQSVNGIRIRFALDCEMQFAILGVISPIMESAMIIPMGPMITSASFDATKTEFSPVAP